MTPVLHERFPQLRDTLPWLRLGTAPSPVRELTDLPVRVPVWLKDDGVFGDGGWGGNKVRKLEWLLAEAIRRRKRTLVTVGGLGTNWGLATARYGREHGLRTAIALVDQPVDDHVRAQLQRLRESGATLHFTHTKARTVLAVPYLLARHRRPYVIPPGGSTPIGVLGYVEAAFELAAQVAAGELPEPAHIVTAVGSGGTAAGLLLGLELAGLHRTEVVAVVVNDTLRLDRGSLTRSARRTADLLSARGAELPALRLAPDRLRVVTDQLGPGYGHATAAGRDAHELVPHLPLEPVYTAKAFAALLDLAGGAAAGPVVFLQTNGPRQT
ncbi:1-aminocyclopropane-1-carboxylate deaminase/D-cysteine desulfhydrase [Nocardia stercoris]|uniref:Pyridoxal-phosphate dependent enzyme n=1 Tax=Nocardia stercoris TaxID=2483361 RepID=A0A3M2KVY8_9NOCA|nr:pyridoxal-phosphate dependent enzyme [Nocardia stercoris]RMI29639.1 pyridoxal-phosphate dependent enzyme [Nocardia stercoris]